MCGHGDQHKAMTVCFMLGCNKIVFKHETVVILYIYIYKPQSGFPYICRTQVQALLKDPFSLLKNLKTPYQ